MKPAIRVENLSKKFLINHEMQRGGYRTLRETITYIVASPIRQLRTGAALGKTEEFWALQDIDFEINPGEVIGIIGRNGAGKSTLLKILSRITDPTTGRIELRGRVGSLLEVGTGFHPELTGRENIYLNGSILGMSRREIQQKFDEIVEFSGVEKFLDTPVKRYSSGMRVRLAFAVAAHLEPEILIIDEVLAVGDSEFQKKCLGKMDEVARSGRTVIFVSHNLSAVQSLCSRCLVMDSGRIILDDDTESCIFYYSKEQQDKSSASLEERTDRKGTGDARFTSIRICDSDGMEMAAVPMGATIKIEASFKCSRKIVDPQFAMVISSSYGQRLFRLNTSDQNVTLSNIEGEGTVTCELDSVPLVPNIYQITLRMNDRGKTQLLDHIESAMFFEVVFSDVFGTNHIPKGINAFFYVPSTWNMNTN